MIHIGHTRRHHVDHFVRNGKAGYRYGLDDLCIWAYANGFNFSEVARLREFAEGVQQGKRLQLKAGRALGPGIVAVWRAEAEGR